MSHINESQQTQHTHRGAHVAAIYGVHTLKRNATHCNTLQHIATHCNTLQHTAPHCITLQHTATHCNTLQHTATHTERRACRSNSWPAYPCTFSRLPKRIHSRVFSMKGALRVLQGVAGCCRVLQYAAVCCNVLQCVTLGSF